MVAELVEGAFRARRKRQDSKRKKRGIPKLKFSRRVLLLSQ